MLQPTSNHNCGSTSQLQYTVNAANGLKLPGLIHLMCIISANRISPVEAHSMLTNSTAKLTAQGNPSPSGTHATGLSAYGAITATLP